MSEPPLYTSWIVNCHSPDEVLTLRASLSPLIELGRVITDTIRTYSQGVERVQLVNHRLGDYFAAIQMMPASAAAPSSFRLVFRKLPHCGRFWKDLMVAVLQEIKLAAEIASITLEYKGDEEPLAIANAAS